MKKQGAPGLAETGKAGPFYGYFIVLACFFMMLVWWGTYYSFGVLFESLLLEFGWTRAMTAGAFSLNNILFGLLGIVVARLCDRFPPRVVISGCGAALGIGYLLLARTGAVWELYIYYGVLIAAGMGAYIAILPIVARWFVKRRGAMTGVVFSGMGIGMMVIPPVVSRLIALYDWRFAFIIMAAIAMVITVLGAQLLRRDPYQAGLRPYGGEAGKPGSYASGVPGLSFREALVTRQFWFISIMYFISLVCQLAVVVHIVIHATGAGASAASAATILVIYGALSVVGMNAIGIIGDRVSNKFAFLITYVLMTAALLLIIETAEVRVLYVFAGIFGFGMGGMLVLFAPIAAELFGLKAHNTIFAVSAFIATFGAAVGPAMAGYIFDVTGGYRLAFIICAGLSAVAVVLTLLLRPLAWKEETNGA